jgi:hypothetical protein
MLSSSHPHAGPSQLFLMDATTSVTEWIGALRAHGDQAAARHLWNRYFDRLVRCLVQRTDQRCHQVADEEDFALSAMNTLFRGITEGRFPELCDRNGLWCLLLTLAERRAHRHFHWAQAEKRGGRRVINETGLAQGESGVEGMSQFVDDGPSPEFAAIISEEIERRLALLDDPLLRQIALLELEGYAPSEILARAHVSSERTLRRKRQLIRAIWTESGETRHDTIDPD